MYSHAGEPEMSMMGEKPIPDVISKLKTEGRQPHTS